MCFFGIVKEGTKFSFGSTGLDFAHNLTKYYGAVALDVFAEEMKSTGTSACFVFEKIRCIAVDHVTCNEADAGLREWYVSGHRGCRMQCLWLVVWRWFRFSKKQ